MNKLSIFLENLYTEYNHKKYVSPDPLQFLYEYNRVEDIEVVGLIASCLAYGRVNQILISVKKILNVLGPNPCCFIKEVDKNELLKLLKGFKHRFTKDIDVYNLIIGIKGVLKNYGFLYKCFKRGLSLKGDDILEPLIFLVDNISESAGCRPASLLPDVKKGSAVKRLNLYLRWMVRNDEVDPGCWKGIKPSLLLVPLDTHLLRISQEMGLTKSKQSNIKTTIEITNNFKKVCPSDPVKYDFALTRFGIRDDFEIESLFNKFNNYL